MEIMEFILQELQKEHEIDEKVNIDELNFVEEGYVTSLGIIQFVISLEEQYNIRFTEEELFSSDFKIVGKLVTLIEKKISRNTLSIGGE